ncbi:MAG: PilZ domain-containing protein [Planctomycetota bacterium]|jgi:hypothetical protein
MERRRDFRHGFRYMLSLKCRRTQRVMHDLVTKDVSASGLSLRADLPHGLEAGDRLEVQLFARVPTDDGTDTLVMATDAVVVRTGHRTAALRFEAPLLY